MIIGIVGDVCSGKSTVAKEFKKFGAVVFDADAVAKSFLEKIYVKRQLYKIFGPKVFVQKKGEKLANFSFSYNDLNNLSVDRRALAGIVFSNISLKCKLEEIIHPLVRKKMKLFIKTHKNKMIVLDIPLLVENKIYSLCDKIIFVKAGKGTLIRRLKERGMTMNDYLRRRKMQKKLRIKLKLSDYIIYNTGDLKCLKLQCKKLFRKLEEEYNEEKNRR
jgi:dephospho-CoA kinase